MNSRVRYVLIAVVLVAGLPVILSPYLPTSHVGLGLLGALAMVCAAFSQARWLNGDQAWNLRILLTKDAWLHPWALRAEQKQRAGE
jgi:hypothetical protein